MKRSLTALATAVLLLSCAEEEINPPVTGNDIQAETSESSINGCEPGVAEVYVSEDLAALLEESIESGGILTRSEELNSAFTMIGMTRFRRVFPDGGEFEPRMRREGLHRWYRVEYSEAMPQTKAHHSLTDIEGVEIVEPVRKAVYRDFNDLTSELWGLWNRTNKGLDINVRPVWENFTVGNSKVIVSVVDGGIDLMHEDLKDNCLTSGHYNAIDGNYQINPNKHGTHVAGTIGAVSNNGIGISGIAGGDKGRDIKGVSLMSTQVSKSDESGKAIFANQAAGIVMAANNGAVISQNSWGYVADSNGDGVVTNEEYDKYKTYSVPSSLTDAIDYFIRYAGCDNDGNQLPSSPMKGGVVIFAAGNESIDYDLICANPDVIAVGAIDMDGSRASFSNYGDWVDICAPGVSIKSTVPGSDYESMQGTSMACPHVSGVAALLVSHFGRMGFTNEMLKEKLLGGANTSAAPEYLKIGGLLDAYGSFLYGNDKKPGSVADLEATAQGNSIDLEWTVPADEDGKPAYGFLIIYDTDRSAVEAASEDDCSKVGHAIYIPEQKAGEKAVYRIKGLDFEASYHVKVIAYSYGRNYAESSAVVSAETTENHAPEVISDLEGECRVLPSETVSINITLNDPDGHEMTYEFDGGSQAASVADMPDGSLKLTIKGGNAPMGVYTAKLEVKDEYDLKTTFTLEYTIRENSSPEKLKEIDNLLLTGKGKTVTLDMSEYVTDADGEQLKYEVKVSDVKIVHANVRNNNLTFSALGFGVVDVKVVAKDARGESVSFDFKVQVKDPSKPLTVYPNPVTDYVNVGTLDEAETTIRIYGATGKLMVEETSTVSGMSPARIDMRSCPPGSYTLVVEFSGSQYRQNIVKL